MPFPPKTIGKLGNISIAGVAWETTQVTLSNGDLRSGNEIFPAPPLYSRANHITSLVVSCEHPANDALIFFSGVNQPHTLAFNIDSHNHGPFYLNFADPIDFPTGVAVKVVADEVFDVYITAKYFVE